MDADQIRSLQPAMDEFAHDFRDCFKATSKNSRLCRTIDDDGVEGMLIVLRKGHGCHRPAFLTSRIDFHS